MKQQTLDIINICKGNTKYYSTYNESVNGDIAYGIKAYIADVCGTEVKYINSDELNNILLEAATDLGKSLTQKETHIFMQKCLKSFAQDNENFAESICGLFHATQVYGNKGYVNGFDERLHKLDRDEFKEEPTFEEILEEILESDTLEQIKKYGHLIFIDVHFDDVGQEIEITIFEYHNKIYLIKYVDEECVMFDNITPCKEE